MNRLFVLLVTMMASPLVLADAVVDEAASNPYRDAYVSRQPAPAERRAEPQIYAGIDKVADYQRLLEDGYDLLGYSSFEAGDIGPEKLKNQASGLHADLALVYTTRLTRPPVGAGSSSMPVAYEYFASFWIRLPPPLLGLHVQRDTAADEASGGLEVLAVIKDSPAARAGLQKGDVLMGLGETRLRDPGQLAQVAQGYAGKTVEVSFVRMGARLRTPVTLAQPR